MKNFVLGMNSSTQSHSGVVLDEEGKVVYRDSINFDTHFGDRFKITHGYIAKEGHVFETYPLMLVAATDLFFQRMKQELGDSVSQIKRITGAGQQHGSWYMQGHGQAALRGLDPKKSLESQLEHVWSRDMCPIWKDASTAKQCELLMTLTNLDALGIAEITGSGPTERFTLPQILKFAAESPVAFSETRHIGLISSLICSLLIGDIAPIDYGDAAGMNLLDLNRRKWSNKILNAIGHIAPNLRVLLGQAVSSMTIAGRLSPYYVDRYGMASDCKVLVFTGDNNDSLLGTGIIESSDNTWVQSFGTSDTEIALTKQTYDPNGRGYVFCAVNNDQNNFGIGVHSNGAEAREVFRDRFNMDWPTFDGILEETQPGNSGKAIIAFPNPPEITPRVRKATETYFGGLEKDSPAEVVRAFIEFEFLNRQHHNSWLGSPPKIIHATGGASKARTMLQVGADIYNAEYRVFDDPDSVSLGGAMRGLKSLNDELSWDDIVQRCCQPVGEPIRPQAPEAYEQLRDEFPKRLAESIKD